MTHMTNEPTTEDVYQLVEELNKRIELHQLTETQLVQEHEELMITVPKIEMTVDVLADHVIGEKIPDPLRPGEFQINGRGEYVRKPKRQWPKWVAQAVLNGLTFGTALLIFLAAT